MSKKHLVIFCTCPQKSAAKIAQTLVRKRLAACVNSVPGITSTYRWQGKIEADQETLLFIKTTKRCFPKLKRAIVALHPYDLPEIIAISINKGLSNYLSWIEQNTAGGKP